jgi:hypothetical protein
MTARDDLSALRQKPFAEAVNKFEELIEQSGRAFLMGAGCSSCAGLPLTTELTQKVLSSSLLDDPTKNILGAIRDLFVGANDPNIEDYLSELIDLIAITGRRAARGANQRTVALGGVSYAEGLLRTAADQVKKGIAAIIETEVVTETHQRFVRALHRPRRPGKATPVHALHYLVLNYDTVLEDALALERVPFADGLDGGATGWWRPETFEREGLAARVFKLHGSINWCEFSGDPLPRRIGSRLKIDATVERRILIWPASTKYRETQVDPFAQLTERTRRVLRPSNGLQCVLVVCGYRFGDSHINLEIERALRESKRQLTVVAFTSDNTPTGPLKEWHQDTSISEQVIVFANRGIFHGTHQEIANVDLLWWKFENITRLLEGER